MVDRLAGAQASGPGDEPELLGELAQPGQRLFGDALLREIEQQFAVAQAEVIEAGGVAGKQLAQMRRAQALGVFSEGLPGGQGTQHEVSSDGNRGRDVRMRVVAFEAEVLEFEGENVVDRRVDPHCGQRTRRARQLQTGLLDMV